MPRRNSRSLKSPVLDGVPSGLIGRYGHWLEVKPITNSRLIEVSFTSPSAGLSQRVANAHARGYILQSLESKFQLTGEARDFLQNEIARVERELAEAERALSDFRREHAVVSLDDRENAIVGAADGSRTSRDRRRGDAHRRRGRVPAGAESRERFAAERAHQSAHPGAQAGGEPARGALCRAGPGLHSEQPAGEGDRRAAQARAGAPRARGRAGRRRHPVRRISPPRRRSRSCASSSRSSRTPS